MIQKIKLLVLSLSAVVVFAVLFVAPTPVKAAATCGANGTCPQNAVCEGASNLQLPANGTLSTDCASATAGSDDSSFNKLLSQIINIISVIVGVVAVIMIIIGGFRYITSGGTPDKVTGAKNTILYGIIGLIIVALAQVIVKFVLNKVTSST